jgi:hypothetical protein
LKVIRGNIKIEGPIALISCVKCGSTYQRNLSSLSVSTCELDHFCEGISKECDVFGEMGNIEKARNAIALAQYISKKVNDDYPGARKNNKKVKKK